MMCGRERMENKMDMIIDETMDLTQPCCVEAPGLWILYCTLVGRYPDMTATHWTVADVLERIKIKQAM